MRISSWFSIAAGFVLLALLPQVAGFAKPKSGFLLDIDGNSVATARNRVCAIEQIPGVEVGGYIRCWSANEDDEAFTPPELTFVQVIVGWTFTCGLTIDRTVHCWGSEPFAQIEGVYKQLSADSRSRFFCGLLVDGSIQCHGSSRVVAGAPTERHFSQVSCSAHHCCALTAQGYPHCWGEHVDAEVIAPTLTYAEFQAAKSRHGWIQHKSAEDLEEEEEEEEEGEGEDEARRAESGRVDLVQFRQLSVAEGISCGLTLLGSNLLCWGQKVVFRRNIPRQAAGPFRQISVGKIGVCVLTADPNEAEGAEEEEEGEREEREEGTARSSAPGDQLVCFGDVKDRIDAKEHEAWDQVSLGCCGVCAVSMESHLSCWGYAFPRHLRHTLRDFVVA